MAGPRLVTSLLAGACALAFCVAASGPAGAVEVVIGGQAQLCSQLAKAGAASNQAVEVCTQAIIAEPISGRALAATYVNRGTIYIGLSNWGSAVRDLDEALEIEPAMGEAFVNRGAAYIGLKRYEEAVQQINRGLELNPEEPEKAYGNRALARWALNDLRGAYDDFMHAHELKPEWTWPTEQLASFRVETRQ